MECDRCWKKCVVLRTVDGMLISDTKKSPRRPFTLCKECSRYFQSKGQKIIIIKRPKTDMDESVQDESIQESDDEDDDPVFESSDDSDGTGLLYAGKISGAIWGSGFLKSLGNREQTYRRFSARP